MIMPTYLGLQGPDRIKNLYAFRSIIDSGARIALGSDFPVESINPMVGFYAAVTRKSPAGDSPHGPDGWCALFILSFPLLNTCLKRVNRFPEQCLTRVEALRG